MVKAMKLNGWESAGCFLHTLQLFVEQSIFEQSGVKLMMTRANKLVSYFKHSLKAMSILHKHQKALHEEDGGMISHNNLILGEKTRWSSYYYMPLRLQQQKRAIRRCDDDYEINIKSDQTLNSIDWVLIPKVISLLQPFADVTTEGERECPCISEVIPSVKYIFHELISIRGRVLKLGRCLFITCIFLCHCTLTGQKYLYINELTTCQVVVCPRYVLCWDPRGELK